MKHLTLFTNLRSSLFVFSVLTVWTCLLTRASNSWKRSCSLPLRKQKDLAKNRATSPLLCLSFPHRCLFSQVKQTKKLHKITTNVYKLFCHFKPNLNLQHQFCRNPVPQPLYIIWYPIMKYASISAFLLLCLKTEIMDIFLISSPLLTGFLKETKSVFERIL